MIGLDVLANAKRGESKGDGGFKVPRERVASVAASVEEEENSVSSDVDDPGSNLSDGTVRKHSSRRYRDIAANKTPSTDTGRILDFSI